MSKNDLYEIKYNKAVEIINNLENQIKKLRQYISDKDQKINQSKENKNAIIQDILNNNNEYIQNNKELTSIRKQKENLLLKKNNKIDIQNNNINILNSHVNGKNIIIKKLKFEKNQLKEDLNGLIAKQKRLMERLNFLIAKYDYCKKYHKESEIAVRKDKIKYNINKLNEIKRKNKELEKEKEFLKNDTSRVFNMKQDIETKKAKIGNLNNNNQKIKEELGVVKGKLKVKDDKIEELSEEVKIRNEKILQVEKVITTLRVKEKEIQKESVQIDETIVKTKADIDNTYRQVSEYEVLRLKSTRRGTSIFVYIY